MATYSFIQKGKNNEQIVRGDQPNRFLTPSQAASTYVPYTGATTYVDLGTNGLFAQAISAEDGYISDVLTVNSIFAFAPAGLLVNSANGTDVALFGGSDTSATTLYGQLNMPSGGVIDFGNGSYTMTHTVGFPVGTLSTVGRISASRLITTGEFYGALGSAAAPTYTYTTNTNTGIFGTGSDVIGFSTGGVERARFSASGHFTINSTSTDGTLIVKNLNDATTYLFRGINDNGNTNFLFTQNSAGDAVYSIYKNGTALGSPEVTINSNGTSWFLGGDVCIGRTSTTHSTFEVYSNVPASATSQGIRIDGGGNGSYLWLAGGNQALSTGNKAGIAVHNGNFSRGNMYFLLDSSSDGNNANITDDTKMAIDYVTGNVSIGRGSTTGSSKLHIVGTSGQYRQDYDASNRMSMTTGSTGITSFDAVGTNAYFQFSDKVIVNTGSFFATLAGTFSAGEFLDGTFTAIFADNSHAGYFTNGTKQVHLVSSTETAMFTDGVTSAIFSSSTYAGYFGDGANAVTVCDFSTGRALEVFGLSILGATLINETSPYDGGNSFEVAGSGGFYNNAGTLWAQFANANTGVAGTFFDGSNSVELATGTYAINAVGTVNISGDIGANQGNFSTIYSSGLVTLAGGVMLSGSVSQGAGAPATILTNYNLYVDTTTGIVYVD